MRKRFYILVLVTLLGAVIAPQARADTPSGQEYQANAAGSSSREYQVKAAFLYNFIKFVDWPKEKMGDANEPITLGIIGRDPFGKVFESVKNKKVKGRGFMIKRFKSIEALKISGGEYKAELSRQIESLRKCHLLFVCSSEKGVLKEIISIVRDHPVVTVGDMKGFLESGGIINFVMENQKVRFEISAAAAKRAKVQIRSQLLRLAKRVVKGKNAPKK